MNRGRTLFFVLNYSKPNMQIKRRRITVATLLFVTQNYNIIKVKNESRLHLLGSALFFRDWECIFDHRKWKNVSQLPDG